MTEDMNAIAALRSQHEQEDERMRQNGLTSLLKTVEGRAFLGWLLALSEPLSDPSTSEFNSPLEIGSIIGKQSIGKMIIAAMMSIDTQSYGSLIQELQNVRTRRDNEYAALAGASS